MASANQKGPDAVFQIVSNPKYSNFSRFPITHPPYYDPRTRCFRNDDREFLNIKRERSRREGREPNIGGDIPRRIRERQPRSSDYPQRATTPSVIYRKSYESSKTPLRRLKKEPLSASTLPITYSKSSYCPKSYNEEQLLDHILNIHHEALAAIIDDRIADKLDRISDVVVREDYEADMDGVDYEADIDREAFEDDLGREGYEADFDREYHEADLDRGHYEEDLGREGYGADFDRGYFETDLDLEYHEEDLGREGYGADFDRGYHEADLDREYYEGDWQSPTDFDPSSRMMVFSHDQPVALEMLPLRTDKLHYDKANDKLLNIPPRGTTRGGILRSTPRERHKKSDYHSYGETQDYADPMNQDERKYDVFEVSNLGLLYDVPHRTHLQPPSSKFDYSYSCKSDDFFNNNYGRDVTEMTMSDEKREGRRILKCGNEMRRTIDSEKNNNLRKSSSQEDKLTDIESAKQSSLAETSQFGEPSCLESVRESMSSSMKSLLQTVRRHNEYDEDIGTKSEDDSSKGESLLHQRDSRGGMVSVVDASTKGLNGTQSIQKMKKRSKLKLPFCFCSIREATPKEQIQSNNQSGIQESKQEYTKSNLSVHEPDGLTMMKTTKYRLHEEQDSIVNSVKSDGQTAKLSMPVTVKNQSRPTEDHVDSGYKSQSNCSEPKAENLAMRMYDEHKNYNVTPRPNSDCELEAKLSDEYLLKKRIYNELPKVNATELHTFSDSTNNALDDSFIADNNHLIEVIPSQRSVKGTFNSPLLDLKRELNQMAVNYSRQNWFSSPVGLHRDLTSQCSRNSLLEIFSKWQPCVDPKAQMHFNQIIVGSSKLQRKSTGFLRNMKLRLNSLLPFRLVKQRQLLSRNHFLAGDKASQNESNKSSLLSLYRPKTKEEDDDLMGSKFCQKHQKSDTKFNLCGYLIRCRGSIK